MELILASSSMTRRRLLEDAGVDVRVLPARIDEESIAASLSADGTSPRDISDALAVAKAQKISSRHPEALVLGCDQILELDGAILSKPRDPESARSQIAELSGKRHRLYSAVVASEGGGAVWRHIGTATLTMRKIGPKYIEEYVSRNWDSIRHSAGSYQLEGEGMRLFSAVDGDYFTVLGLPMLPLLSWLIARGYLVG